MKNALDSSIIISALRGNDPDHESSLRLLLNGKCSIHAHALSETFGILTGGKLGFRFPIAEAAVLLKNHVAPRLEIQTLDASELLQAYSEASARGVRGGAIYDYLHLVAAKKARADRIFTLNLSDFRSFHRSGDPEIAHPAS